MVEMGNANSITNTLRQLKARLNKQIISYFILYVGNIGGGFTLSPGDVVLRVAF